MDYRDQLGRLVTISEPPNRIISLVPSQTELLVDLGLETDIVGVTKFCVHPNWLKKEKTVVGGTKQVRLEKIKELAPDFILCNKEENTPEMVAELEQLATVWVSDVNSLEDNYSLIRSLGELCGVSQKANELIATTQVKQQVFVEQMQDVAFVKALYFIWNDPLMGVGSPSFINQMLKLNKFENVLDNCSSRYPEVNAEHIKETQLLLLSSEPFPFKSEHCKQFEVQYGIPTILVDGEYFSWYGSRLALAFDYFTKLQKSLGRLP